jgi:hypothetical protein
MPEGIRLSLFVYRLLIFAYPSELRRDFAADMLTVFGRQLRDAWSEERIAGIASLWACALREILTVALPSRLRSTVVVASALSLVGTSAIYLALLWALTYTFDLPRHA